MHELPTLHVCKVVISCVRKVLTLRVLNLVTSRVLKVLTLHTREFIEDSQDRDWY